MKHSLILAAFLSCLVLLGCSDKKPEKEQPQTVASEIAPSEKAEPPAAAPVLAEGESEEEFFAKRGFVKSEIWSVADFKKACKGNLSKVSNHNFKKQRRHSVFPRNDHVCDDVRLIVYERNPKWRKDPSNDWRTGYILQYVDMETKEHDTGPTLTWSRKHFPHEGRKCRIGHFCNEKPFVKEPTE